MNKVILPVVLILSFFIFSQNSLARGGWGSGGGTGGVCFENKETALEVKKSILSSSESIVYLGEYLDKIDKIEILDLRQAKYRKNRKQVEQLILPGKDESFLQFVDRLLEPYEKKALGFTKGFIVQFRKSVLKVEKEREILAELQTGEGNVFLQGLALTRDINMEASPFGPSCIHVPIISQLYNPRKKIPFELFMDPRIFFHKNHSSTSQIVALLHEAMYLTIRTAKDIYMSMSLRSGEHILQCFREGDLVRNAVIALLTEEGIDGVHRVFEAVKQEMTAKYPKMRFGGVKCQED